MHKYWLILPGLQALLCVSSHSNERIVLGTEKPYSKHYKCLCLLQQAFVFVQSLIRIVNLPYGLFEPIIAQRGIGREGVTMGRWPRSKYALKELYEGEVSTGRRSLLTKSMEHSKATINPCQIRCRDGYCKHHSKSEGNEDVHARQA